MKVKELILKLLELDLNKEIVIGYADSKHGNETSDIEEIRMESDIFLKI